MKRLLFLFLFIAVFTNCSNDADVQMKPQNSEISGAWNLIKAEGGFTGQVQDFEKGKIIWTFNDTKGEVVIVNANTISGVNDGFPSGTYEYSISAPADIDELIVNNNNLGNIVFLENSFTVSAQPRDGFKYTFSR